VLAYTDYVLAGTPRRREVALTFDDGPGPYTPKVLRVLQREHVPATFFPVGRPITAFGGELAKAALAQAGGDGLVDPGLGQPPAQLQLQRVHGALACRLVADDCLFCRIVRGEVPADVVREDERTLAFRDISPQAPVHVLVIPRRHLTSAATVEAGDADLVADLLIAARAVAEQEDVLESGYRLVFNVGDDALNSVAHLHLHVLGGRRLGWPPG